MFSRPEIVWLRKVRMLLGYRTLLLYTPVFKRLQGGGFVATKNNDERRGPRTFLETLFQAVSTRQGEIKMRTLKTGFATLMACSALAIVPMTSFADDGSDDFDDENESIEREDNNKPDDVGPGDLWQVAPYDFVFGNHLDTHIQLRLKTKRGAPKSLDGALYVYFTGDIDEASGLPVARHPRGDMQGETCGVSPITCLVGWTIKGRPGAAKFLYHSGINGNDHPVWMVNRAEESTAPAAGMVIPQPGYYSHFHWLSSGSVDPRASDLPFPAECDKSSAGALQDTAPTAVDQVCEGWFLQIKAKRDFAFKHGGETILIYKGADLRSHLNIVTNYDATTVVPISPTRVQLSTH